MTIGILDYGAGNLTSVVKALTHVGGTPQVISIHPPSPPASARQAPLSPSPVAALSGVSALVIPGVGHFRATASIGLEWREAIRDRIAAGMPLLGICLGMQWLFDGSDEAPELAGLGLFRGRCRRIGGEVKVPHVGWNAIDRRGGPSRWLEGIAPAASAYFTHTYAVPPGEATVATTTHGVTFAACVEHACVFGAQWHPEKSGAVGLRLLSNFVAMARAGG